MRRPPDKNGQPALSDRDVDSSNATLNTLFGGSRQKSWMISPGAPVRPSPRRAGLSATQAQPVPFNQSSPGPALPAVLASDELNLALLPNPRESLQYEFRELRTRLSSPEDETQNTQAGLERDRHLPPYEDSREVEDFSGHRSCLQANDNAALSRFNTELQLQPMRAEPPLDLQPQNTINQSLSPYISQPPDSSEWTMTELRSPSPLEPDADEDQSTSLNINSAPSLNPERLTLPRLSDHSDQVRLINRADYSSPNHNPVVNDVQMQNSALTELSNRNNHPQVAMYPEELPSLAATRPNPYKRLRTNTLNLGSLKSRVSEIGDHIEAVGGIENLNTGLERPRFQLLQEACNAEDDFYVALHQVFCAWNYDRAQVTEISDFPQGGVLHFAFKVLGQLIRDNGQLAPAHLKWFTRFPNPLPEILKISAQYRRSVRNVGRFLSKLTSDWIPFSRECASRGYPPLVDELITRMLVLSPILQGVMFTATRRNLGFNSESVGAGMEEIHQKDRHDHQILSARMETAQPPTPTEIYERNKDLIDAYSRLLNHFPQHRHPSSSVSRISPSSPFENVNMQASFGSGNNHLPHAQAALPRPVPINNERVAAPDGSVQLVDGRQQFRTMPVRPPGSGILSLNQPSNINDHRLHQTQSPNSASMNTVAGQQPHADGQPQSVPRSNMGVREQNQNSQDNRTLDPYVIHYRSDLNGNAPGSATSNRSRPAETSHIAQHGLNAAELGRTDQYSHRHPQSVHDSHAFATLQPGRVIARYPSELQQAATQQPHQQPHQQQYHQHQLPIQNQQPQQNQQPHQQPLLQQFQQLYHQHQSQQHQQWQQSPVPARSHEIHQDYMTPQRNLPPVHGESASASRGSIIENSLRHAASHPQTLNQNSSIPIFSRAHLGSNTEHAMSPSVGNEAHSRTIPRDMSSNALMSPALSDEAKFYSMTPPMQRNLIPPLGFVHHVQPINPHATALHQAHLRSPRLVPENGLPPSTSANEPGRRFYQVVKGFVRDPSYISGSEPLFTYDFSIPEADFGSIARDESAVAGDIPKRVFTPRTLQYRLRCVRRPKKDPTCTAADWVVSDTRWPENGSFNISFGTSKYQLEIRRKNHYGKDLPIDITGYLRLVGFNTKTRITLAIPGRRLKLREANYFLAIEVIEILTHKDIVDTCLESQHRPASETLDAIKKSLTGGNLEDDDEIAMVTTDLSIELADPFTARIFDIPVRGNSCLHRECFDLETFLLTRNNKPGREGQPSMVDVWRCPLCGRDARPVSLHIDDFLVGVRNELKNKDMLDVKAILIDQDGIWRPKEEEKTGTGKRKSIKDASDSDDDQPKRAKVLQRMTEIIDLDDE